MKNIMWLVNRLRAMSPQEVGWRIQQKVLQKSEQKYVYSLHKKVFEIPLPLQIQELHINVEKLSINWENREWTVFTGLDLFGVFPYAQYKKSWNAGFQTENTWSEDLYSPLINISQREDIGDIRTNWELNRHFQLAALAKSYYCTREEIYLEEFQDLFNDWNDHNLFLHGVEWTSAMELAIRVNSWVYSYVFLKKAGIDEEILMELEHGVLVMTDYIFKHRARFSSANNHLIIEMYAVALVGIITDYAEWRDSALRILTEELPKQNYTDGVNKEMSLHYQSFVMEAYGLLWLTMDRNQIDIPVVWKTYLTAMSRFIADSTGDYGETIEFGDNDEGKILDLVGHQGSHYLYVLGLMSVLLKEKYTDFSTNENLNWIVSRLLMEKTREKKQYIPALVCHHKEGGYTLIRSKDRRVLFGIDHAALGFGTIAAHAHADVLSFQLYVDGVAVLVDSGTYNYHVPKKFRDEMRSTMAHNTVYICNQEQAEMLGPFLWGDRYKIINVQLIEEDESVKIQGSIQYKNIKHTRTVTFDYQSTITVKDELEGYEGIEVLHINHLQNSVINMNTITADKINIRVMGTKTITGHVASYSPKYNNLMNSLCCCWSTRDNQANIEIHIK